MFKRGPDDGPVDRERVDQIKQAIKLGFHHLDGAEVYKTERELGQAIRESGVPRDQLFVTTSKSQGLWHAPQRLLAGL